MRTRLLLTGVALVALLTGCAAPGTGSSTAGDEPTPGASSVLPTGGYSTPPSKGSPSNGQTITVTGTVMAGAEAKCLILKTDTVSYQLLGGDPKVIHEDAHLTVTGVVKTDVMSYCMQGIPLQVETATPA
jgi:hypothetical protein